MIVSLTAQNTNLMFSVSIGTRSCVGPGARKIRNKEMKIRFEPIIQVRGLPGSLGGQHKLDSSANLSETHKGQSVCKGASVPHTANASGPIYL